MSDDKPDADVETVRQVIEFLARCHRYAPSDNKNMGPAALAALARIVEGEKK